MNAKNIISAILMVLSFAACSSDIEGLDDNMTNTGANNGETSISVRMVTEGVSTKAGTTIDLTTEEVAIKNYIIAVFETKSGERVGYLKGSNNTNDIDATKSGVTSLTIGGIDCKAGIVNVVVIANLNTDDEAKFDAAYTYSEFKTHTVNSLDRLVKVGEESNKEISLDNNQSKAITVKLSQLTARVLVNVKSIASVNGDNSGNGDVTATVKAINYKAKVENTSKVIEPVAGMGRTSETKTPLETNNFHFYTYKLNDPTLVLNIEITVAAKGKKDVVIKKEIPVLFRQDGSPLSVLENGKSYQLDINATVSVSVNCDVTLNYTLHEIKEINQDIEFK